MFLVLFLFLGFFFSVGSQENFEGVKTFSCKVVDKCLVTAVTIKQGIVVCF